MAFEREAWPPGFAGTSGPSRVAGTHGTVDPDSGLGRVPDTYETSTPSLDPSKGTLGKRSVHPITSSAMTTRIIALVPRRFGWPSSA